MNFEHLKSTSSNLSQLPTSLNTPSCLSISLSTCKDTPCSLWKQDRMFVPQSLSYLWSRPPLPLPHPWLWLPLLLKFTIVITSLVLLPYFSFFPLFIFHDQNGASKSCNEFWLSLGSEAAGPLVEHFGVCGRLSTFFSASNCYFAPWREGSTNTPWIFLGTFLVWFLRWQCHSPFFLFLNSCYSLSSTPP